MQAGLPERVVIVGAGHGGVNLAALLRQHGYAGEIVLVGEEDALPYHRPPLSKDYLKAGVPERELLLKPEAFYAEQEIHLKLGCRAVSVDPDHRVLDLSDSRPLLFDALVFATGAAARPLPIRGADLANVMMLRTRRDAESIAKHLGPQCRLVIVGGGYVGLEVAASARHVGAQALVLERESRLLARVASPELASWLCDHHRERGTAVDTSADVSEFTGDGTVRGVRLADGREHPCDIALVGVGAVPRTELAASAGVECDHGIVVDGRGRTNVDGIFAVGDVTRRPVEHYGGAFRLESIPSAVEQAKQVTSAILDQPAPRPEVPWFWSDQFDLKVKIAGLLLDSETTVQRGDPTTDNFALYHCLDSRVLAVETVNSAPDFMLGKKLIDRRTPVDLERLADPAVSLRELAA